MQVGKFPHSVMFEEKVRRMTEQLLQCANLAQLDVLLWASRNLSKREVPYAVT